MVTFYVGHPGCQRTQAKALRKVDGVRLWHFDAVGDPDAVDGVSQLLWRLADAQAAAGHEVTLFCRSELTDAARRRCDLSDLRVVPMSRSLRNHPPHRVIDAAGPAPDLGIVHSAWLPYHAAVARTLRRRGIPYATISHGGHTPALLEASPVRRRLYLRLVERPTVWRAVGAVYAGEAERAEAERLFGEPVPRAGVAPFPAAAPTGGEPGWRFDDTAPSVMYLGRYDVFQKGVDDLCEVARRLPDVPFDLYGEPPHAADALAAFSIVRDAAPANVAFRGPVIGDEAKAGCFARARIYLQYSRFEGFPLSVTEALAAGVPVACADRLPFARELAEQGAALLVSSDPRTAARELGELLDDRVTLEGLSARGVAYARNRNDVERIAERHLELYAEMLAATAGAA